MIFAGKTELLCAKCIFRKNEFKIFNCIIDSNFLHIYSVLKAMGKLAVFGTENEKYKVRFLQVANVYVPLGFLSLA